MRSFEIVLIAAGLATDAAAVSLACAASGQTRGTRAAYRLAFHFGFFQFLMPVVGWAVGLTVAPLIEAWDHWVAFGLLALVGLRMVRAGLNPDLEPSPGDPSRGPTLLVLALATSVDALAIGLTLAMLRISVWYPSVVIGVVTFAFSSLAFHLGHRVSGALGKRMEIAGGLLLNLIGARILLAHLLR